MTVTTRLKRAARVILVGAPGVGKGTQAERLMKRFPQLSALSSGDLLRDNVRNRTALGTPRSTALLRRRSSRSMIVLTNAGLEVESQLNAGLLVPDAMILKLILSELHARQWVVPRDAAPSQLASVPRPNQAPLAAASEDPDASFILDGFPRTAGQADLLAPHLPINLAVSLVTPTAIILDRIAKRWVHAPSGRVYNTDFNPPRVPGRDDLTGETLTKRADDSEDVWRNRLRKFRETSEPLLKFYERRGVLWTVTGNSSNEISPKLFAQIERQFG